MYLSIVSPSMILFFSDVYIRRLLKNKQNGRGDMFNITCPTCDAMVPEWAVKRALPPSEYEAMLNQSLQSFIDSGSGVSH